MRLESTLQPEVRHGPDCARYRRAERQRAGVRRRLRGGHRVSVRGIYGTGAARGSRPGAGCVSPEAWLDEAGSKCDGGRLFLEPLRGRISAALSRTGNSRAAGGDAPRGSFRTTWGLIAEMLPCIEKSVE